MTTRAGAPPRGGGPTRTRAWSSGSYQCTPAGSSAPSGTATYTSSGKRPPADPAARNSHVAYGRSVVRTTPADRCSNRERCGRSSSVRATSAVPASTATAGAVVAGRSRGSGTRGSDSLVPLVEPREASQVVDLEVLHHARVVDGLVPLAAGLVGREPVQRLRRGLHASTSERRSTVRRLPRRGRQCSLSRRSRPRIRPNHGPGRPGPHGPYRPGAARPH